MRVSDIMELNEINNLLNGISGDRSVPKNIRTAVDLARKDLNNDKNDWSVRINSAISILDEISNDPNIPIYTRTHIWNIVSMLEVLNQHVSL